MGTGEVKATADAANRWARAWNDNNNIYNKVDENVDVTCISSNTTDTFAEYSQSISTDPSIDIFQVDVVWANALSQHFQLLPVCHGPEDYRDVNENWQDIKDYIHMFPRSLLRSAPDLWDWVVSTAYSYFQLQEPICIPLQDITQHFPSLIQRTEDGKVIAIPWSIDIGLLFYRADIVSQPPRNWNELADLPSSLNRSEEPFIWQGADEALITNVAELVNKPDAFSAEDGVERSEVRRKISLHDNQHIIDAITMMKTWLNHHVSPENVLTMSELDTIKYYNRDKAVLMRNWARAWWLIRDELKDRVFAVLLPTGDPVIPSLGGWQLAVSKYSRNKEAAVKLALWLTKADEQKDRIKLGLLPTIPTLYDEFGRDGSVDKRSVAGLDESLRRFNKIRLVDALANGIVSRPSLPDCYNEFSSIVSKAINDVLKAPSMDDDIRNIVMAKMLDVDSELFICTR